MRTTSETLLLSDRCPTAPAPAAVAAREEFTPLSFGRKPIAEHNAELARHALKWFAPDGGRSAIVFQFHETTQSWLAYSAIQDLAGPGFLNYDGKCDFVELEGKTAMLVRRDMTAREFSELPTFEGAPRHPLRVE